MVTASDIKAVALLGCNVSIDAMLFSPADIKAIVASAIQSGATVLIRNAGSALSAVEVKAIARLASGKVTLEF
jgi:hypothetical protein